MTLVPIKPVEMMNGDFFDFIGVWEDHVPKFVCDKAISLIDKCLQECSHSYEQSNENINIMEGDTQFHSKNLGRKDYSIMMNYVNSALTQEFNQYLHACFLDYIREYGQLSQTPLISTDSKLQRTEPTGGYHIWHYENAGFDMAQRVLTWIIYLNDMPDGEGETEFLYQKKRIPPKRGTCLIWPASFSHVHRGLTVYSQNKYILTGWYINAPLLR